MEKEIIEVGNIPELLFSPKRVKVVGETPKFYVSREEKRNIAKSRCIPFTDENWRICQEIVTLDKKAWSLQLELREANSGAAEARVK